MPSCFFVSDLHGRLERFEKLSAAIERERPAAVFLGGDLLPSALVARPDQGPSGSGFVAGTLRALFERLRAEAGSAYPRVFLILGNDDPRVEEAGVNALERRGLWEYVHERRVTVGDWVVYGYACVPPTPFRLKDWEVYDVSRYTDPGCVAPEDGMRTVPVDPRREATRTIDRDLAALAGDDDQSRAIWLFHAPPYRTRLDRAALDGRSIDHAPLDVHVGSIAIRRFIESRQPAVTLHGHVHESANLTGAWMDVIGRTVLLSAAHDGPELALVRFDPSDPSTATRELI